MARLEPLSAEQLLAEEQAALRRVATLVAREEPEEVVFEAVAREAATLLGARTATTYRFGEADAVAVGSWAEPGAQGVAVGRLVPLNGSTAVPRVYRSGHAVRLEDSSGSSGEFAAYVHDLGIRSTIAAPVFVDERMWGCLTVSWTEQAGMPPGAEDQLEEFTDLLAHALASREARRLLREERDFANAVVELSQALICVFDREGRIVRFNQAAEEATGFKEEEIAGRDACESIVPPEHHDLFREIIERAFAHVEPHPMRGFWVTSDGSRRTIEFSNRPLLDAEGNVRYFVSTGLDVTERERATAEILRLASEQTALRRVATLVAANAEPSRVFAAVAAEAGQLLGSDSAATIRFDGDVAFTVGRWDGAGIGGFETNTGVPLTGSEGLTALVARTGAPARIDDYAGVRGEAAERMRRLGFRSAVGAPITLGGHTWGVLLVASTHSDPLGAEAEHRLTGFTELITLALEGAQARSDLTESRARIVSAGDAERRRLERNLHDGAQQRLVAISLHLRIAQQQLADKPETVLPLIASAADELQLALEELRELARGLHPALLTERGLGHALESVVARAPFPVELNGDFDQRLPAAVEAAFYYIVSECLTNAAKHAEPSLATVTLTREEQRTCIEVEDDGAGGANLTGGSGLQGLADRVEALGGRFSFHSPPGGGTRVRAELPRTESIA
jgi:PAS domain S-box-containing protein